MQEIFEKIVNMSHEKFDTLLGFLCLYSISLVSFLFRTAAVQFALFVLVAIIIKWDYSSKAYTGASIAIFWSLDFLGTSQNSD